MRKGTKYALRIAGGCIAAGAVLLIATLLVFRFDFSRLNTTGDQSAQTYNVAEPFDSLDVQTSASDIRLRPSEDGACRVVCVENDTVSHSVTVENGTLYIRAADVRDWKRHIGIYWGGMAELSVTVYLPESQYGSLRLKSTSGDIDVADGFAFAQAGLESTSGEIAFTGAVDDELTAGTTSGSVEIMDAACGALTVSSTSGDVTLRDLSAARVTAGTTSGEVELLNAELTGMLTLSSVSGDQSLENVSADSLSASATSGEFTARALFVRGALAVGTTSGDICLAGCDGGSLELESTSGSVTGSLTSTNIFSARSKSGEIDVPPSVTDAGLCEITTTSGDIDFTVAQP